MEIILSADNPEQARDFIVAWLKETASGYRREATIAERVKSKARKEAQAAALDAAAQFLQGIKIVPKGS